MLVSQINHTNISCKKPPSKYNSGTLLWHIDIAMNIQYIIKIDFTSQYIVCFISTSTFHFTI